LRLGNPFKRFRLGILFTSTFGGVMVIFLIILMAVSYQATSSYMSRQISHNQQELLNEVSRRIETKMTSIEQTSLSITRNEALLNYLRYRSDDPYTKQITQKEISLYLSNIVYSWDSVLDSIQVYMNNPLHTTGLPAVFLDIQELPVEDWYPLIEHSDFTWIAERQGGKGSTDDKVISFVQKIYSDSNKSLGVLVLNVKVSAVQGTLLNSDNISQGVKRVLLGSGRQMITAAGFSTEDTSSLHDFVQDYYNKADYLGGQRVNFRQPYFVTEAGDRNARWNVIQFTPWKGISEDSSRIALMLGSIGFVAVIIVFFFTLFLSRQFMRPIMTLKHAMNRFSVDMHRVKLPSDYSNEFNILFSGYDVMMERVVNLYGQMERQYIKQKELDVKALQAMINPHFLYNTLDQINWMAIEANQPRISQILELVGKMFRIGLSNGDTIVTVREEIAYIHSYLQIQQIRLSPRILEISIRVPQQLESYYMPKLLLQPFVENAIMHGLHGRGDGLIVIAVTEHKDGIAFIIQDYGNGFQKNHLSEYQPQMGGYGIRNVRERIEALFGEPYGISIISEPNQGAIVTIVIPKRDKTDFYS
jgi:two-component system sensor histidine kinase YesM